MENRLPRIAPGDILNDYHINAPNEALERLELGVGPNGQIGLTVGPAGTTLFALDRPDLWARIGGGGGGTGGTSGPYDWTEQVALPDGGWDDGDRRGTTGENPAFESTGHADVGSGVIVRLRFVESSQTWVFTYGSCG
jgi:hypothetical protein